MDHKKIVKKGYEKCSREYLAARLKSDEPSLQLIFRHLLPYSKVLDIGCGGGLPIDLLLVEKYQVTGLDISAAQIKEARKNVPQGRFICIDVMDFNFKENEWDCIISYYTIFHLTREEQLLLFHRMYYSLKKGGFLLLTLSFHDEDPYIEEDFFGTSMFWSNYDLKSYVTILKDFGWKIRFVGVLEQEKKIGDPFYHESHPIVFGQKVNTSRS